MKRSCVVCAREFDAKRANATYCGDTCRKRAQRAGAVSDSAGSGAAKVSVLAALESAGRADTWQASIALVLADRLDATPGSGAASLAKQLDAAMAVALEGVKVAVDEMDELRLKRDRKRAG